MIKTIFWYFKFFATMYINFPKLIKAKWLLKKNDYKKFYDYVFSNTSNWAKKRLKDSGAIVNVFGAENIPKENVLFVSNHQGDFDVAIFMAMIPKNTGFVSKIELSKIPIFKTWMKFTNCVFINRKDIKQTKKAIDKALTFLKGGHSMTIFPEGTRSKSNKMNCFKKGAFRLAIKAAVPIVPVTISGSYKLKEQNNGIIKGDIVNVFIHKSIYPEVFLNQPINLTIKTIEDIIKSKLD